MNTDYISLLRAENEENIPIIRTDKTDKTTFVSFVSCPYEEKNQFLDYLGKTAPLEKISPGDTATAFFLWRIHFPDREPMEVSFTPEVTRAEALGLYPNATAAEPFTPTIRQPSVPMTAEEESEIRRWLTKIDETDPVTIDEVLDRCRNNPEAREYFLSRASEDGARR
jgi:hypothetical protein